MTSVRGMIGWLCVLIMIPIFIMSAIVTGKEAKSVMKFQEMLDERIPVSAIELTKNSYMIDHEGKVFSEVISNSQNRVYTPSNEIPPIVKSIFIASEDHRFFEHKGFDGSAILRAVFINAKKSAIEQGGSTITQQLARNVYLSHEQSYNRKLSEILYSYQLENYLTKEQILEYYLNAIYFSHGVYGVGTAASYYFNKELQKLHLAELAFICAIPNNPTKYDPLRNFKATKKRQEQLLGLLKDTSLITEKDLSEAVQFPITLNIKKSIDEYPDYVTYTHKELIDLISSSENLSQKFANLTKEQVKQRQIERVNEVLSQGVIIHTALQPSLQKNLITAINHHLPAKDTQGAAVVMNHQTHNIVAIAGGKEYKKFSFNRAYQAYRQPGSAIKPLLVYGPYLDITNKGTDSLIDAGEFCKNGYCPKNFSKHNYGYVSLETALKYSYNTAAVRMLDYIGIEEGFAYLMKFGFSSILKTDYTLAAALGGVQYGVSPLELTDAYTTFGNNGIYYKNHAITKVTNLKGDTLYEWKEAPVHIWEVSTNNKLRGLLSSVVRSGTAQKAKIDKAYVGGKTGTTNKYKDLWFVGLTDSFTAGVWVGTDRDGDVRSSYHRGPQLLIWRDTLK